MSTPPSGTPPLLPIPLPTLSPPLLLPSTDCKGGVSEVTLPPRKRLCIALGPRYEVGESSSAPTARLIRGFRADYSFVDTLDEEIRQDPEREVGYGITNTWDEMLDTDEIYGRLDDAHDDKLLMSDRLNMLFRDRRAHAHTALLMEREARLSRGSTAVRDYRVAGSRPHPTGTACGDIETDKYTADTGDSTSESVRTH
ncbi:hypothetical protein Tco_0056510 [Tanacetum coccineum]